MLFSVIDMIDILYKKTLVEQRIELLNIERLFNGELLNELLIK